MRRWFRSIATTVVLFWAVAAHAHDGPHSLDMVAEVVSAHAVGNAVQVEVLVINVGGPLVLTGLQADGAVAVDLEDIYFNFAEEARVSATLEFRQTPPAAFVLVLNFGVVGHGTVTVRPQAASR